MFFNSVALNIYSHTKQELKLAELFCCGFINKICLKRAFMDYKTERIKGFKFFF